MNSNITDEPDAKRETEHMSRIDDTLLSGVAGGASANHTLCVNVDLPDIDDDVHIKVYFDGLLQYTQCLIPSFVRCITLPFSASGGIHMVSVNIDDLLYKQYELDFDNATVR